jgi:hypothetical protein
LLTASENVLSVMRATPTVAASIPRSAPLKVKRGMVSSLLSSQIPASRGSRSEKSIVQLKFIARPNASLFFT